MDAITTARLDLLPLRVDHAAEMAGVLNDPALHEYIGGRPATPAELRARYERMVAGPADPRVRWLNWVLRLRAENRLVGTVQATVDGPVAEIAWVVAPAWQGRGLATEAAQALVGWLRGQDAAEIVAHVHPDHAASGAVARAAGLTATDERQDGEVRWRLRF